MYKEIEGLNTMLDFLPKEISFFFLDHWTL